ncbi:MMPL family transporter [Nocardioides mangrovi]|uniref:MMPL family transporter n=1 Tax=Nocardioides mangrovi TaxID=2874580 RepID=A0ABS7UCZ3_9ACTN|nr:MMPL family transporter [Nocardioides mangrovi]MBZ5738874.1 MMPL family transporter [Nocardioides mangrovi]
MRALGEWVLRHRRLVMVGWLLITVVGMSVTSTVNNRLTVDFSLPGQPGTETAAKIVQAYGNGGSTVPLLVTVTMPEGQTVTGNEQAIGDAFASVTKADVPLRVVDEANTGDDAFRTDDDRTAYAMVFYPFPDSFSSVLPTDVVSKAVTAQAPDGATVGVTGMDALAVGDESGGNSVLVETLLGGLGALAVLLFVFASLLAFLPLLVAAVSILTTFLLLLPITLFTDVSFIVEFLIALVGLGVAIDYSLLFVTRWREERDRGRSNHEAVVTAMETAGHAVLFSGITVAIGLLALVVLPVPFLRSIGYGGALIPLASVLVTLTLTPAILGGIGPRVDWPKIRHEQESSRGWTRWATLVVRHRWVAAGSALAVLALLAAAFAGIKIGAADSDSLAKNGPAYDAFQVLRSGGVPTGVLTPIEVLTDADQADSVAQTLGEVDGIDAALVPTGDGAEVDGQKVVVLVPHEETVNSQSVAVVRDVQDVADHTDGVIGVAGLGADQVDFLHAVYGNLPLMLGLICLLTFVLLVRAFRSLLLPLKAVVLNLASLMAVFGTMVLFWQEGYGSNAVFGIAATGAVTFWIPIMVFAFLYGLSMDYEVFILSRIREEYDAGASTDEAVIRGIGRTGRLVSSAALILFLAFAALASGPGTDIKVLATGLGIGILLDATVIRSVLVPSLVSLFGSWNWKLPDSVARALRVEPSVVHAEPPRRRD